MAHQVEALKDYLFIDQKTVDMIRYQRARSKFIICLEELEYLIPDLEEIPVIQRRHQNIIRLANGLKNTSNSLSETQQDIRALNSFSKDIQLYLNSLAETTKTQDNLVLKKARELQQISRLTQYLIIMAVLFIFILQFKLIFIPIINSIQKLKEGTNQISKGELNHRLKIQIE
ncbi:MAG: hypothetical protein WBA93_14155 [Microcoleaceae cyanobacterium]